MNRLEVPSDQQVVDAFIALGSAKVDAVTLCQKLMDGGHPRLQSQLAIQRAAERGRLSVNSDWTLSVSQEAVAA